MAVSEQDSWLGNRARYEHHRLLGSPARIAPREVHDEAAAKLLRTVSAIEDKKLVDRISVYRRGDELLYQNQLKDGAWVHHTDATKVITRERERPWSDERIASFRRMWNSIELVAQGRHRADQIDAPTAAKELQQIRQERAGDERAVLAKGRAGPQVQTDPGHQKGRGDRER